MNSDQMSTEYLNSYNNNTTNNATSTTPNTEPLLNLKRTIPGWFLWTRGWPWSSWTSKAQSLLQDTNTYKVLPKDPTSHLKNKLITLLKDIKQTGGLNTQKYKLYPTSAVPPKFYGLPKIHKQAPPSGPLFPVGGPSHMALLRSFPTSSNPL